MLRHLRLRLTLLYLLVALALIALVGAGASRLLAYYFEGTTDLALQRRVAEQFRALGVALPPELAAADRAWAASRQGPLPSVGDLAGSLGGRLARGAEHESDEEDREDRGERSEGEKSSRDSLARQRNAEDAYDAALASVFVLPLDARGRVTQAAGSPASAPPMPPDQSALAAAMDRGIDWRTVTLADGTRVRLLTYRLAGGGGLAALQAGRTLADQDRVLGQLTIGLLGLGALAALLMGAGSWWLAGRSIAPLQLAWEQQQAFVANASHELRTPLTLIRASAEVARRGLPAGDDRRALLDDVLRECDHVGRLVEDLLLLSRLDAGRLPLERRAVALAELLEDLSRQMGRLAEERGIKLQAAGAGTAWADPTRLRQILIILLDNALRYTPPGGSVSVDARPDGRHVRVAVADTGPGIAPEHLPRLFERFYRTDSARGAEGGSGLGLAIAKGLVEAQGGRISLESQVGRGTRVTLLLPAASAPAGAAAAGPA